jgi:hypothetical protein
MTREELTALRNAIDMTLALPDSLRALLAQWLMPEAAKPNGHDRHPPAPASPPRTLKAQFIANPAQVQAAERQIARRLARQSRRVHPRAGQGRGREPIEHRGTIAETRRSRRDRKGRRGQMEGEGRRRAPGGGYGRPYGTPYSPPSS